MININVSNDISWDIQFVKKNVLQSYKNGNNSGFWLVIHKINHSSTATTMDIAEFKLPTYIAHEDI